MEVLLIDSCDVVKETFIGRSIYISRIEFEKSELDIKSYITDVKSSLAFKFEELKIEYNELKFVHNKVIDICKELSHKIHLLNKRVKELEDIEDLVKELTFNIPQE